MTDRRDWFVTASGRRAFVLAPDPDWIVVGDIAHALSMLCRFGGHTREFYSVAQHSVMVSNLVPSTYALHGLLHDASEAYLGDVIRPLKGLLPAYKHIEEAWEGVIAVKYGLAWTDDAVDCVKRADCVALVTERRDLVAPHAWNWTEDEEGFLASSEEIRPLQPKAAELQFLKRFALLCIGEATA